MCLCFCICAIKHIILTIGALFARLSQLYYAHDQLSDIYIFPRLLYMYEPLCWYHLLRCSFEVIRKMHAKCSRSIFVIRIDLVLFAFLSFLWWESFLLFYLSPVILSKIIIKKQISMALSNWPKFFNIFFFQCFSLFIIFQLLFVR